MTLYDGQETQLAVLGMVVRVLYTVQDIRNILDYDVMQNVLEQHRSHDTTYWKAMEIILNVMEMCGDLQKLLVSYMVQAQLTSTLTHVITHDPMTSGAKDG